MSTTTAVVIDPRDPAPAADLAYLDVPVDYDAWTVEHVRAALGFLTAQLGPEADAITFPAESNGHAWQILRARLVAEVARRVERAAEVARAARWVPLGAAEMDLLRGARWVRAGRAVGFAVDATGPVDVAALGELVARGLVSPRDGLVYVLSSGATTVKLQLL